jgi:hypothetical protein
VNADEHRTKAEELLERAEAPYAKTDRLIALAQLHLLLAVDDRLAELMQRPYGGGQP